MKASKVVIADDHEVVIDGIKQALKDDPEFEVVGEAADGHEAVKQVQSSKPDIIIMDISMPDLDGIEATYQIKKLSPNTRIIIFTMHSDEQFVIDLFKAGISAYVLKKDPTSDLVLAMKAVRRGGTYFSTNAPAILVDHVKKLEDINRHEDVFGTLSLREREVFRLLAEGMSVKEIANKLFISPKTVGSHKYNIMGKLQARNTTDLIKIAIKKNLIQV